MARRRLRTILTATTAATGLVALPVAANPLSDVLDQGTDELVSTVEDTTGDLAGDTLTDTVEDVTTTVTDTVDEVLEPVEETLAPNDAPNDDNDDKDEDEGTDDVPVLGSIGDTVERLLIPDAPAEPTGEDDDTSEPVVERPVGSTAAAGGPVEPADEPAPEPAEADTPTEVAAPAPPTTRGPGSHRTLARDFAPAPVPLDSDDASTPRIAPPTDVADPTLADEDEPDRAVLAVDGDPEPFRDPASPLKLFTAAFVAGTAVLWQRVYARAPQRR